MTGVTIIKRKKIIAAGGHHGGAWKVAYADFVTAMMAFFLLMWLLNATTEDQRKGIADYFDPAIPISRISGGGTDVLSGSSIFAEDKDQAEDGVGGGKGVRGQSSLKVTGPEADARGGAPEADLQSMAGPESHASAIGQDALAGANNQDVARDAVLAAGEAEAKRKIEEAIAAGEGGELSQHLFMRQTPEGLVIEIVDQADKPLFAVGSAAPSESLKELLVIVAEVVGQVVNDISIVGHTDALAFQKRNAYTNWELSSDRALAARRILVEAGAAESQIVEVAGKAASEPLVDDPYAPQNRRISITLLRN
ncbi:MAG: OmpA family protein [Alphaproteobacteria bacterium]|nr:OmpA family protein [Alphaproteobacteria bacterium]